MQGSLTCSSQTSWTSEEPHTTAWHHAAPRTTSTPLNSLRCSSGKGELLVHFGCVSTPRTFFSLRIFLSHPE